MNYYLYVILSLDLEVFLYLVRMPGHIFDCCGLRGATDIQWVKIWEAAVLNIL